MRYRQKGFFVAAVLLMNLMSASLGIGLTIPTSESLATFLPPAPSGWKADPLSSSAFDHPTGSILSQAYTGPSGRTVVVTIVTSIKSPTQAEDQEDEEFQCRSDSKEYDIQGFHVYDMTMQCPDYSEHYLYTALLDNEGFSFSVLVTEYGTLEDDGTLRAILESMDLRGLRSLAE